MLRARIALGGSALLPLALLVSSTVSASPIALTTAVGGGADSYVSDDSNQSINTTHGGENNMQVRRNDGVRQKLMYLRFDISSYADVKADAFLSFNIESTANRDRAFDIYGVIDNATNDNWVETGAGALTYNSLIGLLAPTTPNVGEAPVFDFTEVTYLGRVGMIGSAAQVLFTNNAEADTDLDTNGAILNLLNADTNGLVTFIVVVSASDANADYRVTSKEGNVAVPTRIAPTLVIIPEPASVGMFGLAVLGLVARRARRR